MYIKDLNYYQTGGLISVNVRSEQISKLKKDHIFRASYIRAKLNVNLASQIRALRLRRRMTQALLAQEAGMKQSRISATEQPGATKFNIETLIRLASAFKVGLIVKFAPFSEMLAWENSFKQDNFDVLTIDRDQRFLTPGLTLKAPILPPQPPKATTVTSLRGQGGARPSWTISPGQTQTQHSAAVLTPPDTFAKTTLQAIGG
ncbi:XRE family transcriptional regulator [bacterium]|nr:MAG: XRE family transcriptional regulator [bacterium]